jgi:hypothetical protein
MTCHDDVPHRSCDSKVTQWLAASFVRIWKRFTESSARDEHAGHNWLDPIQLGDGHESSIEGESLVDRLHRILRNAHQVLHLLAAVSGAFAYATTVDNLPTSAPGVETPYMAFGGVLMMLFGSRLGNGCTRGHCIAGVPLLDSYGVVQLLACLHLASCCHFQWVGIV